jgi:hypothetical protein
MRIRLLHSYSGALTNERRMPEGEHEVTTELGNYLVDNGHALPVASEPAPLPQAVDVDLATLQAEGEVTVTHDDGSVSTVTIADDEPEPKQNRKQGKR